jgi:hypothetical protein
VESRILNVRLRRDEGRILLSGSSRILLKVKAACETVEFTAAGY